MKQASLGPKLNHSCFITCQHLFLVFVFFLPCPGRRLCPGPEKDAPAGGCKRNGVYDERKRMGKSFVSFIAQTTGVTLMPLLEVMRKRGLGCPPSILPSLCLASRTPTQPPNLPPVLDKANPPLLFSIWCSPTPPRKSYTPVAARTKATFSIYSAPAIARFIKN